MNTNNVIEYIIQKRFQEEKINKSQVITEIAKKINIARGTVTRWLDLKSVPEQYLFDLYKIANIEIDYSQYSAKQKDQFFTPDATAQKCYNIFLRKMNEIGVDINNYKFIEPSAGKGSFLEALPAGTIALDIEPTKEGIIKQDFLTWKPNDNNSNYIVFGNPPFGLRGHLALSFIEHASSFSDFVCFILPQFFESDGKGSPRKRISKYNLIHSEHIDSVFHFPNGEETKVNVIFQILSKNFQNTNFVIKNNTETSIKVYSLSNGSLPSQQRNVKMIGACDFYLPSTCFGKSSMKVYNSFEELPNKKGYGIVLLDNKEQILEKAKTIDWSSISFLSTNSAYNLRKSKILEVLQEGKR